MVMNSHIEAPQKAEERRAHSGDVNGKYDHPSSNMNGVRPSASQLAGDEALRLIHQVLLQQSEHHPAVVAFAAMNHGNGCSRICASVASLLARDASRTVCLVEANLRSPSVSGLFSAAGPGLTDALISKGPIRSFCVPSDMRGNLWLLSCGTLFSDAPALLTSGSLRERVAELRAQFDFVIIDAPPVARYADAIALGQLADGLVLVVEEGNTRRDETAAAVANLRASGVAILAAVLNKAAAEVPEINNKSIYNF